MVTLNNYTSYGANRNVLSIVGLITDTLPTDKIEGMPITNGSTAILINPSNQKFDKIMIFDEENCCWCDM